MRYSNCQIGIVINIEVENVFEEIVIKKKVDKVRNDILYKAEIYPSATIKKLEENFSTLL